MALKPTTKALLRLFRRSRWARSRLIILIGLVGLFFALFFMAIADDMGWSSRDWAEMVSTGIIEIDDLMVRLFGIAVLLAGVSGFLADEFMGRAAGRAKKNRFWPYIGLSSAIVIGGAAFTSARFLDETPPVSAPAALSSAPVVIKASWVQVTAPDACAVAPGSEEKPDGAAATDCPPLFQVRAVIARDAGNCPSALATHRDDTTAPVRLEERALRSRALRQTHKGFSAIKVCSGVIADPHAVSHLAFPDGTTLRMGREWRDEGPRRIAVIGDTGCRNSEKEQTCDPKKSWPFKKLAADVADDEPDLVIHLGDYMYATDTDRWSGLSGGETWEGTGGGAKNNGRAGWKEYFFDPARPLLQAAPWVMVRGNHENCNYPKHGTLGFDLFFGSDDTAGLCGAQKGNGVEAPLGREHTWAVDLSPTHRLIVADSTLAYAEERILPCNKNSNPEACEKLLATLTEAMDHVTGLQGNGKINWLATHVPPFAVEWAEIKYGDIAEKPLSPGKDCVEVVEAEPHSLCLQPDTFRKVAGRCVRGKSARGDKDVACGDKDVLWHGDGLRKLAGERLFPESTAMMREVRSALSSLDLVLAADRHMLQVLPGGAGRPDEIVIGAGGVNLDQTPDAPNKSHRFPPPVNTTWGTGNAEDEICAFEGFGYVVAEKRRTGGGYGFSFERLSGCLFNGSSACRSEFDKINGK